MKIVSCIRQDENLVWAKMAAKAAIFVSLEFFNNLFVMMALPEKVWGCRLTGKTLFLPN